LSTPQSVKVFTPAVIQLQRVELPATAPPMRGPSSIKAADLVTRNMTTGAITKTALTPVKWADRTTPGPAAEIIWVNDHEFTLNQALIDTQHIEMTYIQAVHGSQANDTAATAGTTPAP
jgi:hypothetical protein